MKPARPFLNYFGGKYNISDWILSYFPPHEVYVEVFGGGLSLFMQKDPVKCEIINDINEDLVNLYRVARDNNAELKRLLNLTPFSRIEYKQSIHKTSDPIENARRTIILLWMGIGHQLTDNKRGFRNSVKSGTSPATSFRSYTEMFDQFHERLKNSIIENLSWEKIIEKYDNENTLFYFDPPYVHESRTQSKNYVFEMTDQDHVRFLEQVRTLKGKAIISGYKNKIYETLDWQDVSRECTTQQKEARTETIWLCPKTMASQKQTSFAV